MLIGGGRDNIVENNIMVSCAESIRFDNRGLNWMADHVNPGGIMPERLKTVPYRREPWASRYPRLAVILSDDPPVPKGNVVRNNLVYRCPPPALAEEVTRFGTVANNVVFGTPPGFRDPRRMDFSLRPGSPALSKLPSLRAVRSERVALSVLG
jgi:hypothetical protein